MFKTLNTSVFPLVSKKYDAKVRFIFRQQIQPWHPSSTLVHESAVAALRLAPGKFYDYSTALFDHQKEYFDVSVVKEARNETYQRLATLAGTVGIDEGKMMSLLEISDKPGEDGSLNSGNRVTDDVKIMVKVSPLESTLRGYEALTNGFSLTGESTRWGSCYAHGSVQCKSLNLFVCLANLELMDLARALWRTASQVASRHSNGRSG